MFTGRKHFARSISWLLGLSMLAMALTSGMALAAQAAGNRRKASDLLAQQRKIESTLGALQASSLPGRPISPSDVVRKVGKDPQKLCEYVRGQIAYEPYRGFLKGDVGTLSSGRANSADRSLLLATMLEAAGVKARLVKGTIASDKLPAPAMPARPKAPDAAAARAAMKACGMDPDEFDRTVRTAQLEKQKALEEIWQRVDRDVQTLSLALEEGKVPLPQNAAEPLTEHWWVRTEAGDLDPTLAQAGANETGAWAIKDIPTEEFHTIVFREVIVANGKTQTVLEARHRSADLFGKAVTFANLAMDWQQRVAKQTPPPADVLDSLKDNRRFRATICVEDKGTVGKLFDVDGTIVEEDASRSGAAKGIGGGLGGMFGGGGEEKKPRSTLDECRLEVEFAAPGEKTPLVVTRSLLRPGAVAAQKVYDLCTTYQFLAMPEDISEALIAHKAAQSFEKLGQWLKDCGDKDPLRDGGHRKIARLNGELWGFALARRNELRRLGEMRQTIFVHERPTLVASFSRLIDDHGMRPVRGIDIFCNRMAAPGAKPQRWSDHPLLQMGVLDTALEQIALERPGGACQNSSMLLDQARLANPGAPGVLLKAQGAGGGVPDSFSESARRQMSADLKGAVLVAIPGKVGAWYRVDLADGSALGYVENGGGQALTEHIEDSALVWMVYEYMNIYCQAVQCLGRGFAMAISMDPETQREEFAVCVCEVALEVATSVSCILKEADPESLLDFGKFFAVSKGWGKIAGKICEKAFEGKAGGE